MSGVGADRGRGASTEFFVEFGKDYLLRPSGVACIGHGFNHRLLFVGECDADASQRGNTGDRVVECFADLQCAAVEVGAHRLANVKDCLSRTAEVCAFDLGERGEDVVGSEDCVVTKQRSASAGAHCLRHLADLPRG